MDIERSRKVEPRLRARRLAGALALVLTVVWLPSVCAQELRVRKNIDDLTADELATYIHAIETLMTTPDPDPAYDSVYARYAALHNVVAAGPCEHGRDTFLSWHRAHLWLFENALRASDPPRTANVTIPYWDWSAFPSGKRYPLAFEDENSILFKRRNPVRPPTCKPGVTTECFELFPTRDYLDRKYMVMPWAGRGAFGGAFLGGEATCHQGHTFGGTGQLEQFIHDSLHGDVGGDLAHANLAANDPIFWSFHNYFDLVLAQWQALHPTEQLTCLDCRLCGMEKEPGQSGERYTVRDLLDIEEIGYRYEVAAAPVQRAEFRADQAFFARPGAADALSGKVAPEVLRTMSTTVPEPGFRTVELHLDGLKHGAPFEYTIDLYLYPETVRFRPRDPAFRGAYLVGVSRTWGHRGEDHESATSDRSVVFNLNMEFTTLAQKHAGETWSITATVLVDASGEPEPLSFEQRVVPGSSFSAFLHFDDMDLRVIP